MIVGRGIGGGACWGTRDTGACNGGGGCFELADGILRKPPNPKVPIIRLPVDSLFDEASFISLFFLFGGGVRVPTGGGANESGVI